MQQYNRCRVCGNKEETIRLIISDYSKLALKEYKTRHDWLGKAIHWELSKKFEFDHMNKWYMHNPESVLENEMKKFFGILKYKRIILSRPDDQT